LRLIFSFQLFCSQDKPQSNPEQSEVGANSRAPVGIRTTRSSKAANNNEAPAPAYISSQQLQENVTAKRRQNAKKIGGEIFVTPLPAVNVSVSAVKVFIVVLIICCHSDNFMNPNETLVCYMLLLHPFHYYKLFDA